MRGDVDHKNIIVDWQARKVPHEQHLTFPHAAKNCVQTAVDS